MTCQDRPMPPQATPLRGPSADVAPALPPRRRTLEGLYATLVPLDPAPHGDSLWKAVGGPGNDDLWSYLFFGPFAGRVGFDADLAKKAASDDPLFFAIIDHRVGHAAGYASYMRMEPVHRVIEVGSILYAPVFQRTAGATEAMYLMARHAFEELGYRRYEWKCDALN